ncbi:MAG: translocation/assembly module TamB domain-containing protein, partial [Oceanidesulfovibrio sp.]
LTADSVMLLTGNEPVGPEAVISLSLAVTGDTASPTATIDLTTRNIRMRVAEDSPLSAIEEFVLNAQARVGGGALEATATVEGQQDSQLHLEATLPATFSLEPFTFELPLDGALSGSLRGDARLESFEPVLAFYGVQASGRFQADFTLSGRLDDPSIDGKATISNGRIEYVETGSVVDGLDLEFVAAQSPENESPRLIINLTAGDGEKGSVKMSGWVDVDPQRSTPFRINVALARFTAVRMDSLRLAATGDAALEGDMEASRIVGGISLAPVQVWLPDTLPPDVVEVEVVNVRTLKTERGEDSQEEIIEDAGEPDSESAAAEPAAFDPTLELGVEVKKGMRVQGLGVDTTWKGRLDVGGRLTMPKLTGNVEVTEGNIDFLGKRFNIRKGVLSFWGQTPPSPRVDVEATIDAGDVLAIIRVHGSANSPQFSLASEPIRPRDEILSYILFGQDLNRVSPVQAVKIAQTAAMLASGSDFLSIQRNASKLPLLGGLDIGLTNTERGGALAVGTEIVDDVHVNVEEGLAGGSTQVEVEVDVSKQFSVHGTMDNKGDQSVGFDWRLDY